MASTASPLRTVPRSTAPGAAVPAAPPAPVARARAGRGDLRRGNHPAGRALSRSGVATPGGSIAPVLPLRLAGAVVVPLRPGASRAVPGPGAPADGVAAAADPAPVGPARLRLTRRGRVVLSGLGVVAALGVAAVVGPALGGAGDPALELAGRSSVVVHSGDTLWSIAESVAPHADPRGVVDALREANGLEDTRLVPGQVLVLP